MGYLQRLHPKALAHNAPTGVAHGKHGLKGFAVDKGQRAVMAAALGAAKGYYYDKLVFKGVGIEAIVGAAGLIGAAVFHDSHLAPMLERAGDTGMTTYLYSLGASWGADKAGRGIQATKTLPGGKKAVVGAIPPRQGGAFLTAEEMANYANPR